MRGVAALAALLLLWMGVAAALAVAVSRGWQRERLRRLAESYLSRELGEPLRIGALEGPLLPDLVLRDLRLGPAEAPHLGVDRLSVRLDADASLTARAPVVDRLAVAGLRVALARDADGGWRIAGWPVSEGAAEPPDPDAEGPVVTVRSLHLLDARVELRWREGEQTRRLDAQLDASVAPLLLPFTPEGLAAAAAELHLRAGEGELPGGERLADGELRATLRDGRVAIEAAQARGSFGALRATGDSQLQGWLDGASEASARLEVDFERLDPVALTGVSAELNGRAEGRVQRPAHGGFAQLEASGRLDVGPSRLAGRRLDGAQLRGSLGGGRWALAEATARGEGIEASARGSGEGETLRELHVDAALRDFGRLLPARAGGLGGDLRLRARLSGPVARPQGELELSVERLRSGERALGALRAALVSAQPGVLEVRSLELVGGELDVVAAAGAVVRVPDPPGDRWPDAPWSLEGLRLESGAGTLALDGDLAVDGFRGLRARAEDLDVPRWLELARIERDLSGRVHADLELRGPYARPSAEGTLRWSGAGSADLPLELLADLETREERLHLVVRAAREAREFLTAHAVLPYDALPPGNPLTSTHATLELRGEEIELGWLAPLLPRDVSLRGSVAVDLALKGGPQPSGRGRARLAEGTLVLPGFEAEPLPIAGELRLAPAEGGVEIETLAFSVAGGALEVDGVVGAELFDDGATRLRARARQLELATLRPLLARPIRDLRGRLDGELELRGGPDGPRAEGHLDLEGGRLAVPLLRQSFGPIRGRIELAGATVSVPGLEVGEPGARARLTGRVELEGASSGTLDLRLDLEAFPLSRSPLLRTDASGEIRLGGRLEAPALSGRLALQETSLSLRPADDPVMKEIRILADPGGEAPVFAEGPAGAGGPLDAARVAFQLDVPSDTWVRGEGAELDIRGTLDLRKEPFGPPLLSGRAEVVRGRYTFLRKRFEVRRGSATFDGAEAVDPILDVEAQHRVRDVTIVIDVTGRASDPRVRLSSEPPMPDADVVSFLFAGRPADQLAGEQRGDAQGAGIALAAGVAASEASDLIGEVFPLVDTVDIRIAEDGTPSRIGAGSYVTDRIFLNYGHTFGPEPVEDVSVEVRVTDHISLESGVSSDENAGLDVIWKTDY